MRATDADPSVVLNVNIYPGRDAARISGVFHPGPDTRPEKPKKFENLGIPASIHCEQTSIAFFGYLDTKRLGCFEYNITIYGVCNVRIYYTFIYLNHENYLFFLLIGVGSLPCTRLSIFKINFSNERKKKKVLNYNT